MTERLLQYLWNYKIFKSFDFKDTSGNAIEVLEFGHWNTNSGPDFLMAKIKTKDLVFVGNIELHINSSDWIAHQHTGNADFENIILHVVYNHDIEIESLAAKNIPTLELRNHIDALTIRKYQSLSESLRQIPCAGIFKPSLTPITFCEESVLRKLDEKSGEIEKRLAKFKNDYEAVLFHQLMYAFGLKVNAEIFLQMAESIDYKIFQKISRKQIHTEALFYGISQWLDHPLDDTTQLWQREHRFLRSKYKLPNHQFSPKFLRLRPASFPTIRLSQIGHLYATEQNLFSKLIYAPAYSEIAKVFANIKAGEYWDSHYNFGKTTPKRVEKKLSKTLIENIIINAILPLKYTYQKHHNVNMADEILGFYEQMSAERNRITREWENLGIQFDNALQTQAFIYHYKSFCVPKNCLNCSIGFQLLKPRTN